MKAREEKEFRKFKKCPDYKGLLQHCGSTRLDDQLGFSKTPFLTQRFFMLSFIENT